MNTEQIIKALECHLSTGIDCYQATCPLIDDEKYRGTLKKEAMAFIKGLLAENAGLKTALETLQGVAKDYENHNENLRRENKYLRESLAEEMEHKEDMGEKLVTQIKISEQELKKIVDPHIEKIKSSIELDIKAIEANTVKKMQEKLKAEKFTHKNFGELVYVEDIDQIAKEILEGTQND